MGRDEWENEVDVLIGATTTRQRQFLYCIATLNGIIAIVDGVYDALHRFWKDQVDEIQVEEVALKSSRLCAGYVRVPLRELDQEFGKQPAGNAHLRRI